MSGARNSFQKDEFFTSAPMKIYTFITVTRAILVYQDKALEITMIDYYCLNRH